MRAARLVVLCMVAAACTKPSPEPTLTGVSPDRGPADRDVVVTISGTALTPLLVTDFSRTSSSVLDATFSARLGREPLRGVQLSEGGSVAATVPAGISPGTYDLSLTLPSGTMLTLPGAYRVLAPNEVDDLITGFRFDVIGPQQVGVPFRITVTAVDAQGAPVDGFSDVAQLTDVTGTVVPRTIGPFARGVWSGPVEVRTLHAADVLTATSSTAKTGSSNPFAVAAGMGTRLTFITPPRSAVAGSCSGAVTVQIVDAISTPSAATVAVALALMPSPAAGFTLFSDAACTVPLAAPAIAAGTSDLTLYFSGTRAGQVQLTATAPALSPAMQNETVTAGPPGKLVFLTPDPTLNSGTCSSNITIETRDAYDNPAPVPAAAMVALDVMPVGDLEVFAADGCTTAITSLAMPLGASTADLQLRGGMAGAFTLTASSAGLTDATLRVRVNPAGFPTQLAFVSTPQSIPVGTCSGPLGVQSQDAAGNAVASPGALPVDLAASPATGFAFFDDDLCSMPITSLTLGVNSSTRIAYFRGTTAGAVNVTASSPGLQSGAQTEVLLGGAPTQLVLLTAPQTVRAGVCSSDVQVGLTDSLGNAAVAPAMMTVGFAAAPAAGVTFFTDAACTLPAAGVDFAAGAATGRIWFKATVATAETVTASSPGLTPAQQVETITPAPPAAIFFVSPPQSVGVGACSAVATVEVRDAFGNVSGVPSATVLGLAALPGAGFTFYSDASCATTAASIPLAAAATTASFFFRGTALGPVTVTATVPTLTPAQQVETVVAGTATQLVFTTAPRSATAAVCSAAVTVEVRDASGNASPVPAPRVVTVSAAGLTFYSDAGCTTVVAGFTVPIGSSNGTVYFRSNTAQAYPTTASSAGLTDGLQTETVTAAAADRLAFVTPPRTASAGACSAVVTVARRDPFGNDAPGAAAMVGLVAAPAAGFTFYSDATCTTTATSVPLANGAAQASFWFIGTVATGEMLTASSAGLTPASQAATVTAAAAPTQLVFTTPVRTVTAGACSAVLSVQSRDSFNNPRPVVALTPVTLAGAATFYSDVGCTLAVASVNIAAGMDTASFYFRANTAGPLPLTATAAGLNPANQTETINAAAPDRLVFTTAPQTRTAGACSLIATVQPRDPFGNVSGPPAMQTIGLTATGGGGVTFYSDATCTTVAASVPLGAGATTSSFYFRGTQAGVRTLNATVAGWTAGTQTATFSAGAPSQLVFTTPARTVASGACSAALTVEARDALGNVATVGVATNVNLSALPAAGFTFFSDAACSTAVGTVQIPAAGSTATFYVRGTVVATVAVTASAAGLTAANQNVTVTAGAPATIVFVTPARSAVAGVCSQVLTVELRDSNNNVATAAAATVLNLAASPALGFTFHGNAACSMASGTATVPLGGSQASFYFSGTLVGTIGVTVSRAGLTSANQNQTVTAGPAVSFAWNPVPATVSLNTPFGVTVRARDAFGNTATSFVNTAVLSLAPAGMVSCTSSCTNATTTDVFVAGVWTGTVTVSTVAAVGANRTLIATRGAVNGTSGTFTVSGAAPRSPPIARFTSSRTTLTTGGMVTFDASASTDWQTPTANLQVAWDPGTGSFSAFSTVKTFSHTYPSAGTFHVRLQVRDADGDIDYRSGWVHVFNGGTTRCTVNTASDVDDGATNCTGSSGPDGRLSLSEAVRLVNSTGVNDIEFSGPLTITSVGSYSFSSDMNLYAQPGVILVGKTISFPSNNTTINIFGLEMTGQTAPLSITGNTADVRFWDLYMHDMPGITDTRGFVALSQVRMVNCLGPCVDKTGANPGLITVRGSELRDSPGQPALRFSGCSGNPLLDMYASTLSNLAFGVQATCSGSVQIRNNTFNRVGTAVALNSGGGNQVINNIVTNATTTAATCGSATFTSRNYHQLFANASNGCFNGDPNTLTSDPQYAFESANDTRLAFGSPAVNSGFDTGIDLVFTLPGNYLGSAPDRGGRESY